MVDRIKVAARMLKPPEAEIAIATPGSKPRKYNPTMPRTAKYLAQRGATQAEMAECFNVSTRCFQNWLNIYPELQEAVAVGVEAFDTRVERALAERAIGFFVDVVTEIRKVKGRPPVEVTHRKYFPPDVTAQIFFLKNRMPEKYRDVQRVDVTNATLKSADEIRQTLLLEFKDLVDQGLLQLPAPQRKMKDVTPRGNGHGNGHQE